MTVDLSGSTTEKSGGSYQRWTHSLQKPYSQDAQQLIHLLESSNQGLTFDEAIHRQSFFGKNAFPSPKPPSPFHIF